MKQRAQSEQQKKPLCGDTGKGTDQQAPSLGETLAERLSEGRREC